MTIGSDHHPSLLSILTGPSGHARYLVRVPLLAQIRRDLYPFGFKTIRRMAIDEPWHPSLSSPSFLRGSVVKIAVRAVSTPNTAADSSPPVSAKTPVLIMAVLASLGSLLWPVVLLLFSIVPPMPHPSLIVSAFYRAPS